MNKPREFWIRPNQKIGEHDLIVQSHVDGFIHVREVVEDERSAFHHAGMRAVAEAKLRLAEMELNRLREALRVAREGINLMGLGDWSAISAIPLNDRLGFSDELLARLEEMEGNQPLKFTHYDANGDVIGEDSE